MTVVIDERYANAKRKMAQADLASTKKKLQESFGTEVASRYMSYIVSPEDDGSNDAQRKLVFRKKAG